MLHVVGCRGQKVSIGARAANLVAACLRAGISSNPQEPPERRLQPRLAALQDAVANYFVDTCRGLDAV
jgi:hypothetical protein